MMSIRAIRLAPIVTPDMLPGSDGSNINGPSLIRMPEWAPSRLGSYYLYFAHHDGEYIRLAYADELTGSWQVHPSGTLMLEDCPALEGHIASPDVHVDHERQRIVMHFHGPDVGGSGQKTYAATSSDGIRFTPRPEILGPSYVRIFEHDDWHYGIFGAARHRVFRSRDGLTDFQPGPCILPFPSEGAPNVRHVAVQKKGDVLIVYYSRRFDTPERILFGTIDLRPDWNDWVLIGAHELLRPQTPREGADLPVVASKAGAARGREHALRDPAVYEEGARTWLLYTLSGESGIALAELEFQF